MDYVDPGASFYETRYRARVIYNLHRRAIECGNLAINHMTASTAETPFGGVKDSGLGREGGVEGLETYTVVKNVSHLVQFDCR